VAALAHSKTFLLAVVMVVLAVAVQYLDREQQGKETTAKQAYKVVAAVQPRRAAQTQHRKAAMAHLARLPEALLRMRAAAAV